MKHTVNFIVLLALVLSAGFFSVDIAAFFIKEPDSITVEPRGESSYTEPAYDISFGFDPMGIVRGEELSSEDEGDNRTYAVVCAAMMKDLSNQHTDWQFNLETASLLMDSIQFTERGYVYADRFSYTSRSGTEQLLDFIVRSPDLRIVYVRFYTDDDTEADEQDAKKAVHDLTMMSERTYSADEINYWNEQMFGEFGDDPNSRTVLNAGNFADIDHALSAAYSAAESIRTRPGSGTLGEFWIRAYSISWVYFYRDGISEYNFAANYIINTLYEYSMSSSKCTVYKGRIYQSINFGPNRLYMIYNIADGRPEGFFAKPSI